MRTRLLVILIVLVMLTSACSGAADDSFPLSTDAPEPGDVDTSPVTTELVTTTTLAVEDPDGSLALAPEDLADGWVFEPLHLPIPPEVDPMVDVYDSVKRLVVGPSGMVAFGDFFVPGRQQSLLVVWRSDDGREWREVGKEQFANAEIHDVAAGEDGFVAVGNACTVDDPNICMADPAIWTSPDGRDWSRVPHDPAVFPGCTDQGGHEVNEHLREMLDECPNGSRPSFERVSATSNGFLAIGMDPTWTMLWYSENGLTWNRVDSSARPQFEQVDGTGWWVSTDNIGAWTEIGLLQQGQRCIDIVEGAEFRSECYGFIWSSDEGQNWSEIDISDETLAEWTPVSIATDNEKLVVFGIRSLPCTWCPPEIEPEISIVALTTIDGNEWASVVLEPPTPGTVWEHNALVTPLGYLAMAEEFDEPRLAAMWHSADGSEWTLIPEMRDMPQDLWANSLGWDGEILVMFGSAMQDDERILVLGRWPSPSS